MLRAPQIKAQGAHQLELHSKSHGRLWSRVSDGLEERQKRGPVQRAGRPRRVRLHLHQPDG